MSPEAGLQSGQAIQEFQLPADGQTGMTSDEGATLAPENGTAEALVSDGGNDQPSSGSAEAKHRVFRILPLAGLGYGYDSNITLSNSNALGSSIMSIAGGMNLELGDYREHRNSYLEAGYLGVGTAYDSAPADNTYNQFAHLLGHLKLQRLIAEIESVYSYVNAPNRYVGGFFTTINYFNALRLKYAYSRKTQLLLEASQVSNIYPQGFNSYFNQILLGGDYDITSKVKLGAEAIVGANPAQQSPTRYYQILNGRLHYDLTGKLALKATAGVQQSEYASGGMPTRLTPVFSVGYEYRLFSDSKAGATDTAKPRMPLFTSHQMSEVLSDSSLVMNLYRNQQVSPNFQGQDYIATGIQAGINKSFGRHWSVNLSFGYENDAYLANQQNVQATRSDNYVFIRPGIDYKFLKYLDLSLFYERSFNHSSIQAYAWNDNRLGMELKTAF